jgi:hypothetical protein
MEKAPLRSRQSRRAFFPSPPLVIKPARKAKEHEREHEDVAYDDAGRKDLKILMG